MPPFSDRHSGRGFLLDLPVAAWAVEWFNAAMTLTDYLTPFHGLPELQRRITEVLQALPDDVQQDFFDDPRFGMDIDNYEPGEGWSFFMPTPGPLGQGSRRVVLRPKLEKSSEEFAKYIIAHEFAHAFLRNGGWGEITDIEEAADALAASWGFHKVSWRKSGLNT